MVAGFVLTLILALPTTLASFSRGNVIFARQDETASEEYTSDSAFRDAILEASNRYRKEHNATALKWNETLEEMGREWSEGCVFEHSVSLRCFDMRRRSRQGS